MQCKTGQNVRAVGNSVPEFATTSDHLQRINDAGIGSQSTQQQQRHAPEHGGVEGGPVGREVGERYGTNGGVH